MHFVEADTHTDLIHLTLLMAQSKKDNNVYLINGPQIFTLNSSLWWIFGAEIEVVGLMEAELSLLLMMGIMEGRDGGG